MRVGTIIDDRYELESLAGVGGTSSVYRAFDRANGDHVALKLLNAESWPMVQRFAREVTLLSELRHPGIVRYVGHGIAEGGVPYLAMEWLKGRSLAENLKRHGRMSIPEALSLIGRVAGALSVAHARGIIHRDLKPSNLFLVNDSAKAAKLLDFGLACGISGVHSVTRPGNVVGTPGYMSPEQVGGDEDVAAPTDVFSLGCVLYECLTGRPAFSGRHVAAILAKILLEPAPSARRARPEISAELEHLLMRMLAKDPSRRPSDAGALIGDLARLAGVSDAPHAIGSIAPGSLTAQEQGLLCVLMVRDARWRAARPGAALPAEVLDMAKHLRKIAGQHAGKLEILRDASILVSFEPDAAANDLAFRAANCALSFRRSLPSTPVALAIGLGVVAEQRPIGEVIDRAAWLLDRRLLRSAESCADAVLPIDVDSAIAGLLETRFELEAEDSAAASLTGPKAVPDAGRLLLGKPTPCLGRERELASLLSLFEECVAEPAARAVLMLAPAGVGKSRLRYEFLRQLRARPEPAAVWQAWADPSRAGSPFALLSQAVRGALGLTEGEPPASARAKLRESVGAYVNERDRERVAEFLGELVSVPLSDDASVQLRAARRDPRVLGDQIARAWEDWLVAVSARTPVVLVLEDLHWGDWTSLALVEAALRNLEGSCFFVFALGRPEVQQLFPNLWKERGIEEVSLRPLPRLACEKLVSTVLGEATDEQVVARLVEHAAGNAFYLEELIRAEAEGNSAELPASILAMVQARLGRLPADARQVLRGASVLGQTFWEESLAALTSPALNPPAIGELLRRLTDTEWIRPRRDSRLANQSEYTFRHAFLREAAYATLTDEDRALGHRLAGEWLERAGERDAGALAEHFWRGGSPERAVHYYVNAAEQALKGNDLAAAIAQSDRAAECGARGLLLGRLRLVQAEAHNYRNQFALAAERGAEAMQLLQTAGERHVALWAHAAHQLLWSNSGLAEYDAVERLSVLLRERTEMRPDAVLVLALAVGAGHLIIGARAAAAQPILSWLRAARHVWEDDPLASAGVKMAYGILEHGNQNLVAAMRWFEAAARDCEPAGHDRWWCFALVSVAACRISMGDFERAESALRMTHALARRLGVCVAAIEVNWGVALTFLGRLEEGEKMLQTALRECERSNDRRFSAYSHITLARIHLLCDQHSRAVDEIELALPHTENFPHLRAYAWSVQASSLLACGCSRQAAELAERALSLLRTIESFGEGEVFVRLVSVETRKAVGKHASARALLRDAHERLLLAAEQIEGPELRHGFLTRIPENARTLGLARQWLAVKSA